MATSLGHPERPFVAVLGGAKVSDKIEVIENLIPRVDRLLIGGAMAYTFFKAMGKPVGTSLVEDDKLDAANDILARATRARAAAPAPRRSRRRGEARGGRPDRDAERRRRRDWEPDGTRHRTRDRQAYARALADAKTVVWNGPMGVFEIDAFARGRWPWRTRWPR